MRVDRVLSSSARRGVIAWTSYRRELILRIICLSRLFSTRLIFVNKPDRVWDIKLNHSRANTGFVSAFSVLCIHRLV